MTDLEETYRKALGRMERAANRSDRDPSAVQLVVVGKSRQVSELRALYDLGQLDFGENRAQELVAKAELLPSDIRWHFVGPLQTNKVRSVRPLVTLLHSLDRDSLAAAWLKGPGMPPPALCQVNIGREPQKHGVQPEQALDAVNRMMAMGVPLRGLMAIPPQTEDAEGARPYFRQLARLGAELSPVLPSGIELSMGMSDDFEVAIEEGATVIRLGRAIFPIPSSGS
ncbi:MAG TPA: YggS family pyridoxal phosphate-dependent enzyme [Acidimicrobiia bacterium]|nr:YggS family pyridoxal phosphate-dependent enzyme [Acidimicrobiia bacterium]